MLEGLEFGFLSGVLFFSHSLLVINSYGHDKMGQSLSLGKHILSYLVCYIIKGKWKLLQPLALLYHSV